MLLRKSRPIKVAMLMPVTRALFVGNVMLSGKIGFVFIVSGIIVASRWFVLATLDERIILMQTA